MRAFVLHETDDEITSGVEDHASPSDEVVMTVLASALNYKDHLVAQPHSRVRRASQLVMGVEAAGQVLSSTSSDIPPGATVVAYGDGIGVSRDGGFAELLAVPARYVTVIDPAILSARHAMIFGLAGFTAMASVLAIERFGATPGDGEVLVTGATGGVGSLAVTILARRGYDVVASTGSLAHSDWLGELGAVKVVGRDDIADRPERVLASERWAGAIDCVGGDTLTQILRSLRYGAPVAASGLVASAHLDSSLFPFITRNVALIGIDAVETPTNERQRVWDLVARAANDRDESLVERTLSLEEIPEGLRALASGATRGRWLVEPAGSMTP